MNVTDLYNQLFGRTNISEGDVISMAEHGRVGGVSTKQPFKFVDLPDYAIKITESGDYTYIAVAPPGTAQSAAAWKAFRMDSSSGLLIEWADGDEDYNNVATDLTALSYS